jgi:glutamyl-tRNA synthetase
MHIRSLTASDLETRLRPFLLSAGLKVEDVKLKRITPHIQPRLELLPDAIPLVEFLFKDTIERDLNAMLKKGMDAAKAREVCTRTAEALDAVSTFEAASIEAALRKVADDFSLATGPVFTVVRIAVTGQKVTPPLFESIFALGQRESVQRLKETANLLGAGAPA